METNKAAVAAMQDSDGASDCSHFSIITPPSPPAVSNCGRCCSQDNFQEKAPDVAPVAKDHEPERPKDKKHLPTKNKRPELEAPEPCIHSRMTTSEHVYSRLADAEAALERFQRDAAVKSANETNSTFQDAARAGHADSQLELQKEIVALLKNRYRHLWDGVAGMLHQAMFEDEFFNPAGPRENLSLADRKWCLELVKDAFIGSILDDAVRGAVSMHATPALASGGITPGDKKKKKKGVKGWQSNNFQDPYFPTPPPEPYPGPHDDSFAQMQSMPYLPPANTGVHGMPQQYPNHADPFGPYPPQPPNPEMYGMPPPAAQYPNPPVFYDEQPPYRRRSVDLASSSSLDRDDEPKGRVNKTEVRWWVRTALSVGEVLWLLVIIIAVFRTPGILGELVDGMHPRNKDRCLGFKFRR